ncbi:MAG: tetratricopeptide repeat protein [Muribaculaceae bacterium]|nr:tetratricopeptide repeat protein [Muribaculaceae bacterium]
MKTMLNYMAPLLFLILSAFSLSASAQSVREERKLISEGNKLFTERKYAEAAKKYEQALCVNSLSAVSRYNLGLAQIKQVTNPQDTTPKSKSLLDGARKNLGAVASLAKDKPGLASKANYNLGNLEYNTKEYKNAIEYYKQALRINPEDESARKNLRIAQKQMQNQDQNQDQNEQNKDQNKDQDKNQDKEQNKDQNKDQQNNNKDDKKENDKNNSISQQTANQILQAMDNKENQTRARVNRANKGEKSNASGGSRKKW